MRVFYLAQSVRHRVGWQERIGHPPATCCSSAASQPCGRCMVLVRWTSFCCRCTVVRWTSRLAANRFSRGRRSAGTLERRSSEKVSLSSTVYLQICTVELPGDGAFCAFGSDHAKGISVARFLGGCCCGQVRQRPARLLARGCYPAAFGLAQHGMDAITHPTAPAPKRIRPVARGTRLRAQHKVGYRRPEAPASTHRSQNRADKCGERVYTLAWRRTSYWFATTYT